MTPWQRFITQYRKDLKLWSLCMAVLTVFRAYFIFHFRSKIAAGGTGAVLLSLANGMRFDAAAATFWSFVPFLLTVSCAVRDVQAAADRVRRGFGIAFSVTTPLLFVISIGYFREYNDVFNHFLFNLYYDDTRAIFATIWTGYHPVLNALVAGALSFVLVRIASRWLGTRKAAAGKGPGSSPHLIVRILVVVGILALLFGGMRGSFGRRPAKLEDVAVTRDPFLNKAVLNPYNALLFAIGTHRKLSRGTGALDKFLPDHNVRKAAGEEFGVRRNGNLDDYLVRVAPGTKNGPPRHVFLVVMESYDAWPLLKKYAILGLTPELGRLAREGIHIWRFLPESNGTAVCLSAIMSGLPDADVVTNYQRSSAQPYATAMALAFHRLGYRTRFFYGGNLSWQRIGDFARGQAFDEVYGSASIPSGGEVTDWGVEDDALFRFVNDTVAVESAEPSLNVIMTTSYHPPYELDVYGKGFKLRVMPETLRPLFDGTTTLMMLGHLWYSDRCIGDFVREGERRLPGSLYAFTGDHFSRKFLNDHPDSFEGSAVPFILYGKDVLRGITAPRNATGSHIDIGPTLVELAAPKGFTYHAMGKNVLGKDHGPYGFAYYRVVGPDFLLDLDDLSFHPLPDIPLPRRLPDPRELKAVRDRLHGIAWWRIMRGPALPEAH